MIKKIDIDSVHSDMDEKLQKYVLRKIGHLDRFLPHDARESVHAEVKLKEGKAKDQRTCACEVVLYLPKDTVRVEESTVSMYAAIDIVEAKLKIQLKKYKETRARPKLRRRVLSHLHHQ
jgi:ribosomal subunit interface protein